MNIVIVSLLISTVCLNTFVHSHSGSHSKVYFRGCYFTNWSQYRPGIWKYLPENYESGLCSHLFYAFVSMGDDFRLKSIENNDEDAIGKPGLYTRINSLKKKQSDLKTILSFGGYVFSQFNGPLMRKLLADVENRKIFIVGVINFVRRHEFDGFDFNWFPEADTKDDFVLLVKEMREAFEKEAIAVNKPRLILTAGVPPQLDRIEAGYDGKALSDSLDYLNVMAFDYHGAWENTTGFNTPIFDNNGDGISINSTFAYLIYEQRVPREKLIMGYATYGRGWTVPGSSVPNQVPSLAIGPSPAQPFTLAEGVASYYEICELIERDGFIVDFDTEQRAPFAYKVGPNGGVWITFDNVNSYNEGIDWLIKNELGGAFVWALDMDDFIGHCTSSKGKYPLVKAIRKKLTE